jgi:hypothetical protein
MYCRMSLFLSVCSCLLDLKQEIQIQIQIQVGSLCKCVYFIQSCNIEDLYPCVFEKEHSKLGWLAYLKGKKNIETKMGIW